MNLIFRKTLILLGVCVFALNAKAQEFSKEDIQYLQNIIGSEKREVMTQIMPNSSAKFWEVYDKYEADRQKVALKRLDLINKFKDNLNNQKVKDQVIFDATKLFKKNDALISKYFKKLKRAGGSANATTFVKVEKYILSSLNAQIMADLILLEL